MSPRNFYFTITPGRSGTVYLAELLKLNVADSVVFHERTGYLNFGVVTPDASDLMLFNSVGNVPKVQNFWKRKFSLDLQFKENSYIEISHFLSKAGLLENIEILANQEIKVHIIILKRDLFKNLWSYINHFDFVNIGFTWLFTIDLRCPNKIVDSKSFQKLGMMGSALWYLCEMAARAEYYKLLYEGHENILFHEVDLTDILDQEGARKFIKSIELTCKQNKILVPGELNKTNHTFFGDDMREQAKQLVDNLSFDPQAIAQRFFDSGRRLGTPKSPQ